MYRTLISTADLATHLHDTGWRVVDCRFDLSDVDAGQRAWREAHIPGAVYADIERDLSAPVDESSGRHPLPPREALIAQLGNWGIDENMQVVAYDASGGAMAARLWWLLQWLGHEAVAVLDGGWQAWKKADMPMDDEVPVVTPRNFEPRRSLVETGSTEAIRHAVDGEADWRLVDARAPERFRGEIEPIDIVAGHIPGAFNRPFAQNLDNEGFFLAPEILGERFRPLAAGRSDRVVHYCGSGVTACHNVLAMTCAGLVGSRLYPGSWSEWIRDPANPVMRGGERGQS